MTEVYDSEGEGVELDLEAETKGTRRIDLWLSLGVCVGVALVWIFFA